MSIQHAAVQEDVMLIALSSIPHRSHVFFPMPCHENSESLFGFPVKTSYVAPGASDN